VRTKRKKIRKEVRKIEEYKVMKWIGKEGENRSKENTGKISEKT